MFLEFGANNAVAVPQKYSADEYLAVLAPLKALCGKVDKMRAVGLDADSAHHLLALVWQGMTAESVKAAAGERFGAVRATCPSDFYPTLPGQASRFDDGRGGDYPEGVLVRHPFAFEDGRLGFYLDESMIGEAKKGTAHSSVVLPAALGRGEPKAQKAKGLSGLTSGLGKGKGKGKEVEVEGGEVPAWPEEREDEKTAVGSGGSSTGTVPFPKLPDEDLQRALLAAYEVDRAARKSVKGCPSPERVQGEAAEDQMPGSSGGRVSGGVAGRLQERMSRLTLKDKLSRK